VGSLILPQSGRVYLDTQALIYTVERHPAYGVLLEPLWLAARSQGIEVVSSELLILETLVGPLKSGNPQLLATYEHALFGTELRLFPITQVVLRKAADLRACLPGLRTPDAIHAATALVSDTVLFITNDDVFHQVPRLPFVVLRDLVS